MKGPKGITSFLSFIKEIIDIGKAKQLERKILKIPNEGRITNPTKNISFISAPPKVSFLNILFPNNIIIYINENNKAPDKTEKTVSCIPKAKSFSNTTTIEKNNVTSSGIIK